MIQSAWMNGGAGPRSHRRISRGHTSRERSAVSEESSEIEDGEIESDADESSDVERLRFSVTKDLTRRIDQYLTDRISHLSRSGVRRLIEEGLTKVNGRVIKASYRPRHGDKLGIDAAPERI